MDAIKAARKTWRRYSRYHQERREKLYGIGCWIELLLIYGFTASLIALAVKCIP